MTGFGFDYDEPNSLSYLDDVRSRIVREALAAFERGRVPGVAYASPDLVRKGESYYIEWRPIGFEVVSSV